MDYRSNVGENTSTKEDATIKLANFISNLEYEKLPPDVVSPRKYTRLYWSIASRLQ